MQLSLLTDIMEYHDRANQPPGTVINRRRGMLNRDLLASAVNQQRVLGHFDDLGFPETANDRAVERLPGAFADNEADLGNRASGRVVYGPAG